MTEREDDVVLRRRGDGPPVTLRTGDCMELLAELEPASVDVVVTSPPYNLGIRYGRYDDRAPREDYLAWIGAWAERIREILAEDGSLFLNVGGTPADPWVPFEVASQLRDVLELQNVIHWVKSIAIEPGDVGNAASLERTLAVGHYKPINSPRFLNDCHEFVFHFTRSGKVPVDRLALGVPYQDKSNVARWKAAKRDLRCRGNCWFVPYETIQSRAKERPHPATFPSRLPEMAVRLHGVERTRLMLDPFCGLGSSAVAAVRLGVPFLGIELDPAYVEVAVERVRGELGELFCEG